MKDYNKNTFWTCRNEETGDKKYYMKINDVYVEVKKEVYAICFNSYRKALRDTVASIDHPLISLDQNNDNGDALIDLLRSSDNLEETVYFNYMIDKVYQAIETLDEQDRKIAELLLFEEKSEQEISDILGMKKYILNYRKTKVLEKIRNILENFRQN